jgi:hypothetical protein
MNNMNNEYMKVKGREGLARDPHNNSIINVNSSEYNEYVKMKKVKTKENQKIKIIEEDLDTIKSDIDEIKSLLGRIANGS